MPDGKGGKKAAGGDAAPRGGDGGHNKGGGKAEASIASQVWNHIPKAITKHFESAPKHADKASAPAHKPSSLEKGVTRFLHDPVKEGKRLYNQYVVHKPAEKQKGGEGQKNAHPEKLSQAERAKQGIREGDVNGHKQHYDKQGRIEKVEGKKDTTINVHYDKGNKPISAEVMKDGQVIKAFKQNENVSLRIDASGDLIASQKVMYKTDDSAAPKPVFQEERVTADGAGSVIRRNEKGERLDKSIYGTDQKTANYTRYQYNRGGKGKGGDSSVVATVYAGDGRTLRSEFIYEKPEAVEKNDASTRIDYSTKEETRGRFVEKSATFNLHQDKENPVARQERIKDYNKGVSEITQQAFEGKKCIAERKISCDEMGRPNAMHIKSADQNINIDVKFTRSGKPESVSGDKGGIEDKRLLASAQCILDKTAKPALEHEQLLAYRGPSEPREGDRSSGTLVYKIGNEYTTLRAKSGELRDENKKVIGHIKDNGDVEINGQKFNIITDKEKAAAFTGLGTDGRYLDLTQGQNKDNRSEGFSGYITNGVEKKLVVGGHVFNNTDKSFFGHVDEKGKMEFSNRLDQRESASSDISQVLKGGFVFKGNENGKDREFDLDRTSSGKATINIEGKQETVDVRLGMMIDPKTGEQLGKYRPPRMSEDGKFDEGQITWKGKELPLSSLAQSAFNVQIDGQDKAIRGYVLSKQLLQADGTVKPGANGCVDLDAFLKSEDKKRDALAKECEEKQKELSLYKSTVAGDPHMSRMATAELELQLQKDIAEKQKNLQEFDAQLAKEKKAADNAGIGGGFDAVTIKRMEDFVKYDPQVRTGENINDPKARLDRLREIADNRRHVLESFQDKSKVSGDFIAFDPNNPTQRMKVEVKDNLLNRPGSKDVIGSIDPQTGKITMFDDRGNMLTTEMQSRSMRGSVIHLSGTSSEGKPLTVDWINDGTGRMQSADELRKYVAIERGLAALKAGNVDESNMKSQLTRTSELERNYLKMLDESIKNRQVSDTGANGVSALDMVRGGPREYVRAEHNKVGHSFTGGTISVPALQNAEACKQVSGDMRVGNNHYFVKDGLIYKMSLKDTDVHFKFDALGVDYKLGRNKQWIADGKPCGVFQPGYIATIDGQTINLQNDQNFLFKMKIGSNDQEHLVMGLGETRRDITGRVVGGGLIDARDFIRQADIAKKEVETQSKLYKDGSGVILGGITDASIGGRDAVLDNLKDSAKAGRSAMESQINESFYNGLYGTNLTSQDIDRNSRSIQNMMRDLNLSATDAQEMSAQGLSYQSGVREGAAMVVTAVASGGSSLLVQGGMMTARTGLAVAAVSGGLGSAAIRQTHGGDMKEFGTNFLAGTAETLLMSSSNTITQMTKNLSAVGKEAKLCELASDATHLAPLKELARKESGNLMENLTQLARVQAEEEITTQGVKALASNPAAMRLADMIAAGKGQSVQAFCDVLASKPASQLLHLSGGNPRLVTALARGSEVSNAYYQSFASTNIAAFRTGNYDELNVKDLAEGGLFQILGDRFGMLAEAKGPAYYEGQSFLGKILDRSISGMPEAVANNTVNSFFVAKAKVKDVEKQNIANELGLEKDQITDEMYRDYRNEARMNAYVFEQVSQAAMTAALTHPATSNALGFMGDRLHARNEAQAKMRFDGPPGPEDLLPSPMDLPWNRSTVIRDELGQAMTLVRNPQGELRQVHLQGGPTLTKVGENWRSDQEITGITEIADIAHSKNGPLVITARDGATWTLHADGRQVTQYSPNPGFQAIVTVDGKDHKHGLIRESDRVVCLRKGENETLLSYDADGQLNGLRTAGARDLLRGENGWHLAGDPTRIVMQDVRISPDGTITKVQEGRERRENADGSAINIVDGRVSRLNNPGKDEIVFAYDEVNSLSEVSMPDQVKFVREGNGWIKESPNPEGSDRPAIREPFAEVTVNHDGMIRTVDSNGVSVERHLDGTQKTTISGDPINKPILANERAAFARSLERLADPVDRLHLEEGMFELQQRLQITNGKPDETMASVFYEVNRLLNVPGRFADGDMPRMVDELISMAANPDLISQGGFNTCVFSAYQQREFSLHPERMFTMLRRINERGTIIGADGQSVKFDVNEKAALPDGDARSHYPLSKPFQTREDGNRFRASQILQQGFDDIVMHQRTVGNRNKPYNVYDINPLHYFMSGIKENITLISPKSPEDLQNSLLAAKREGILHPLLFMDSRHTGNRGYAESGGHVRLIKDIRQDQNSPGHEYVIDLGNTWKKAQSHETMSPRQAFEETLSGLSDKNLQVLIERVKKNPTDVFERIELAAWKLGFLDASIESKKMPSLPRDFNGTAQEAEQKLQELTSEKLKNAGYHSRFAEDALELMGNGQKIDRDSLRAEFEACEKDLNAYLATKPEFSSEPIKIVKSTDDLDFSRGGRSFADKDYKAHFDVMKWRLNNLDYKLSREDLPQQTAPSPLEQINRLIDSSARLRGETSNLLDEGRTVSSLDLVRKYMLKDIAYESASTVDNISGYANYKGTIKFLDGAIKRANETGEELHFCYIDVRKFKNANQVMGMEGGDNALRLLTKHLAKELGIKEDELMARPGGDELAIAFFRPKSEVEALVKKIEDTHLSCVGYETPDANGRKYGMKLVKPQEDEGAPGREGEKTSKNELIIYPVVGVVTYQRPTGDKPGDNPHHLMERADALMTKRKEIDDMQLAERALFDGKPTINQIPAFDPDFDVTRRDASRYAKEKANLDKMPPLTGAELRSYIELTKEEKLEQKQSLQNEIDHLKANKTDSTQLAFKQRLLTDIKLYEDTPDSKKPAVLEAIDSLAYHFANRQVQYRDAWLNPHTKLENREMANRELLRTAYDALRLRAEPGFEAPTVFMVDIDNMKAVNDEKKLGHESGNNLMQHAGEYLKNNLPEGTKSFSPSGGSFIIIAANREAQLKIERALERYGTEGPDTIPPIDLGLIPGSSKLKFGLSYGKATFDSTDTSVDSQSPTHIVESLKRTASAELDNLKEVRIAEGRIKPRKAMEIIAKTQPQEGYDSWVAVLSNNDAEGAWQLPRKTESVLADSRQVLRNASEERKLERDKVINENHDASTKADDDDIFSVIANLHQAANKTPQESEPSLDITNSVGIPKDYVPGKADQSTVDNKNGDKQNGGKEGDGRTQYPSQQFDHHVDSTPNENTTQPGQRLEGPRPVPQDIHTQLEAQRLQRNADSRKLFSKEGAAEETIEEASYVYRGGLTKNHAKALDTPDSKALDNLLYRQFKIDSDPKYGDNTLKTYINAVDACIKDWTPTTDATILDSRKQALQKVFDDFYKSIGMPSPKIEVDKSMVLDAEGANASYSLGKNVITIQESMLQGYDQKLIIDTAHEGIGHAVQDQQSDRIVMYEMMKRSGIEKTSDLFEEDGKTLNSLGEGFLSGVAAQEKPIKGDVDRALLLANLQLSKEWLDTRVGDAKFDPRQDADYMRGLRVVRSLLDENGVETDRQGKPSMVSQDRLKRLVNLMTGKDINDSVLTGPNETYASLSLDVNNQLKRERGVDTIADPQKVFEQLLKQENEDRQERFNRHGRKDTPAAYAVDLKFEQMLASPKFFENNKEFLSKYVEMKQTNDPVRLVELRKEWQEVFKSENPGSPAPSTHLVTSRLDRVAYLYMEKHFQNKDAADLGTMTREKFMEVRGNLAREVLRDALEAQNVRDYNRYRASYYEFDAHFIHQRVERMLKTNDRTLKSDVELSVPRSERQLALARNFEPVKAKTNEIKRLQPAWQDASPLPTKFAKAKEEAPPVKPRGAISLFSKALADQYKKIDPMAERTKPEEQKYQDLKEQLESDVRSKLQDLVSCMVPEKQGEQLSGYELPAKLRSASGAEGDAQQEAFFKRLTKAINDGSLMDLKNAGHPEVVVHNNALVKTIEQEFPNELTLEKNRGLRLGLTAAEANQRALVKVITDLSNGKLVNEVAEDALIEAQDRATERASHWIGLPVPSGTLLDQIGCDYLLVNKHTGEYYPLDVTIKGQDRTDRLVECQAQNTNLHWQPASAVGAKLGKMVPAERTPWVMSVVDDLTWGNLLFRAQQKSQGKISDIKADLERQTVDSTAVAVMSMLQTPSGLNLYDHPLPSFKTNLVSKQKQAELDLYVPILKNAGKLDWAKDIDTRVRTFIKNNP